MIEVDLREHNQKAYNSLVEHWKTDNRACVVHPTGTGKSYIIMKIIEDNQNKNKVILAPSNIIFDQMIEKNDNQELPHTYNITYQRLINMNKDEISKLNPKLIVLDEFHHTGAEVWGKSVQTLIDLFPKAKLLGTSATHIRYGDGERNMADELFDNNIVSHIALPQAIAKEILSMPLYVNALYTFDDEVDNLKSKIENSHNSDEDKTELNKVLELAKHQLENSSGIPVILKKYIKYNNMKFIVFCKNETHLNEMTNKVINWFSDTDAKLARNIRSYTVLSKYQDNDVQFEAFKNDTGSGIKLLFCVDMLNEGLHLNDIDGVILLRPTFSPVVYYQQIGRCMSVGNEKIPIIFDFVNNFNSVRSNEFVTELENAIDEHYGNGDDVRESKEKRKLVVRSRIFDESKNAFKVFRDIQDRLVDSFEYYIGKLKEYKVEFGNCLVPQRYGQLGNWCNNIRQVYKKGQLSEKYIATLNEIGFIWDAYNEQWFTNYYQYVDYYNLTGNCDVPRTMKKLYRWGNNQRIAFKKGLLSKEKINLLNEIGFIWDAHNEKWFKNYYQYVDYYNLTGNYDIPKMENKNLYMWGNTQRTAFKKDLLSKEKINLLNEIGFVFNKQKDLTNMKFGRLTVIEKTDKRQNKSIIWKCKCDCNNQIVEVTSANLTSGVTKSCGCLRKKKSTTEAVINQSA